MAEAPEIILRFSPEFIERIRDSKSKEIDLSSLTHCISSCVSEGLHSEAMAKRLCRQFGGHRLPKP